MYRNDIPDKLIELVKELYTDTCSCVLSDGVHSEWFHVLRGVRQDCTVAPDLYLNPMDWILNRTVEQTPLGVSIGEESFTDLDYADDVILLAEMLETLVAGLLVLQDEAAPLGLKQRFSRSGNLVCPSRRSRWQQKTSTWWTSLFTSGL